MANGYSARGSLFFVWFLRLFIVEWVVANQSASGSVIVRRPSDHPGSAECRVIDLRIAPHWQKNPNAFVKIMSLKAKVGDEENLWGQI